MLWTVARTGSDDEQTLPTERGPEAPTRVEGTPLGLEMVPGLLAPGTLVGGRFRIETFLATGGMGEVYRAVHVHLNRPVALKLVRGDMSNDETVAARFLREAQLLSQLESPHVVRVFDFGQSETGRLFLAMELVDGRPLDVVLREEKRLDASRAIALLVQVCRGLEEAHGCGVVHRDLKPANIMVGKRRDGGEVARILDFGIARRAGSAESNLTTAGLIVGTPAYMPPEQARGETLDARADLYALGCVAWKLLTGRTPFVSDVMVRLVSMHLNEATPAPESVNPALHDWPALCAVLIRALQKKPDDRYQSAREFADALEAAEQRAPAMVDTAFPDWPSADQVEKVEEVVWPPPEEPAPSPPADPAVDAFFGLVPGQLLDEPKK